MRNAGLLLLMAAGCSWGPRAVDHPIARNPGGPVARIALRDSVVRGELLAVTDSGLWLLVHDSPAWASYADIRSAAFEGYPERTIFAGPAAPPADVRAELRLASRYPQGISPALLHDLLKAYLRDTSLVLHR